ncbi:hypothetical protein [Oceanobacter mangrovi]|uniref:hypothetical protein n=1 Tax=Oceanobacter mangrovi TaxID=2862510 RepID=UPI001C8D8FC4|nr:hypothetical protein [Oceanobacter mangrovi]
MNQAIGGQQVVASWKQLLAALLVAMILLVGVVLPAEFGIDPSGIGQQLGLTQMRPLTTAMPPAAADEQAGKRQGSVNGLVWFADDQPQQQQFNLSLASGQGLELKVVMLAGQQLLFAWQASGFLYVDMHADQPGAAADDFISYREQQTTSSQGALKAGFGGNHGWYWKNNGTETVTLTLSLNGYYQGVYMP